MDTVIPVIEDNPRFDLLDRQEFVDRILKIAKALSDNKKNACYAINGNWGVGKSFVLDMFEGQAKDIGVEGEELPRYLIFRYNCWEYDYYEEPLVAIVASILDQIDENVDLLSAEMKTKIVAVLKTIGKSLAKKAIQVIEEKTGVNLMNAVEILKEGNEVAEQSDQQSHAYDKYFDFKKNLNTLQKTIASLSRDQTVIFIVDELDRCLPEYTIKVLERLHHLFNGISNVQVVLSIDVGQLEHVVKQIYGEGTDAKKYLRKFIQFELHLDEGEIKNNFNEKFNQYTQHFTTLGAVTTQEVETFKTCILLGYDMRTRISIIDRCALLHNLLCKKEYVDSSYMCLEMFFVVLSDLKIDIHYAKSSFDISAVFSPDNLWEINEPNTVPKGLQELSKFYNANESPKRRRYALFYYDDNYERTVIDTGCLLGLLLFAYRKILGFEEDACTVVTNELNDFINYCTEFWNIMQIIR